MNSVKLLLFDLDGTLVTTGGAGLRAMDRTFEELFGLRHVTSTFNPQGKTDPAIFREIVRLHLHRDLPTDELSNIAQTYLRYLEMEIQSTKTVHPLRGVKNFLNYLKTRADAVFGLGTGNLEKGARLKLSPTTLNSYFSFGGFGSDSEKRYEILRWGHRRAEERIGQKILPQNVFIIGDTVLDIVAAHQAGYRAVAVASGSVTSSELQMGHPEFLLSDMTEGQAFLERADQTPIGVSR